MLLILIKFPSEPLKNEKRNWLEDNGHSSNLPTGRQAHFRAVACLHEVSARQAGGTDLTPKNYKQIFYLYITNQET
jgi:hypothetical protein